jgi:hypothetical protein
MNKHDEVWRDGFVLTRQHWQRIDRMNADPIIGGRLVVVQGGRSGAPDSASTHFLLGVADYRRWNLNNEQAHRVTIVGRDLMGTCHERTTGQGFDPHFHDCTIGDDVPGIMDPMAIQQVVSYKAGGDGVAGTEGDWQPYRPNPIHDYVFLEEDMDAEERQELFRIGRVLDAFREGEVQRDQAEADRDKRRFTEMVTQQGQMVDLITTLINSTADDATKLELRRAKERILTWLKENQSVTGVDNPDDDQMP